MDGGEREGGGELPLRMLVPMLILASLCTIVGVLWLIKLPVPLISKILSDVVLGVLP